MENLLFVKKKDTLLSGNGTVAFGVCYKTETPETVFRILQKSAAL